MKWHGLIFAILIGGIGLVIGGAVARSQDGPVIPGPVIPGIDALPPLPAAIGKSDEYTHPSIRRKHPQQLPKPDRFDGEPDGPSIKQKNSKQLPTAQLAAESRADATRGPSWLRPKATPNRTDSNLNPNDRPFTNRGQDLKAPARTIQQNDPRSERDLPSNRRNVYSGQVTPNLSRLQADSVGDRAGTNPDRRGAYGERQETPRVMNSLPKSPGPGSSQDRGNSVAPKTGNSWFRKKATSAKPEPQGKYPAAKATPKPAIGTR